MVESGEEGGSPTPGAASQPVSSGAPPKPRRARGRRRGGKEGEEVAGCASGREVAGAVTGGDRLGLGLEWDGSIGDQRVGEGREVDGMVEEGAGGAGAAGGGGDGLLRVGCGTGAPPSGSGPR